MRSSAGCRYSTAVSVFPLTQTGGIEGPLLCTRYCTDCTWYMVYLRYRVPVLGTQVLVVRNE